VNHKFRLATTIFVSTLSINSALALPIDWSGVFGVDTHTLSNIRHTKDSVVKDPANKNGTEGIQNGKDGANFQTYIFKLNPQMIVNDGVTLKGEISSGYIRGGFGGDNSTNNADGSGNNAFFYNSPAQRSGLNLNQMYMELYADTALIKLGRFAKGYGLGIVWDAGTDAWDRFFTMYDGIEAEMKIGNFSIIPHFAKISSYNNNPNNGATGSAPSGASDVREIGLLARYDNKNTDLVASVLYAKRSSEPNNTFYNANSASSGTPINRGHTQVTVIEPFISKKWNKFKVAFEGSLQSGDYGNVYQDGTGNSKIAASAFVVETKYELNPKWDLGVNAGQVSGDKGSTGKFEGTYLHPNYHIAELMFRYNYSGFNEGGRSVFDASIANTRYIKLYANYKTDKWTWKGSFVTANAMEAASAGSKSYHHEENYRFDASANQSKKMGSEVDVGFDYRWNPNVLVSAFYGFWFVGDYYAFTNSATQLSLQNVHGGGLSVTLQF
jgi:hypothetical protein